MKQLLLFIMVFCVGGCLQAQLMVINVVNAGARGDGKTVNTRAIQRAIDKVAASGGGTVMIPAGKFVSGALFLKSYTTLHLAKGAVLLGSTNRLDYGKGDAEGLVTAKMQQQVSITGSGTIDGRGKEVVASLLQLLKSGVLQDNQWKVKRPEERNRPKLINFVACTNVAVRGITVTNGSGWIQDYLRCTNVIIDSVTVISRSYWNNDGIDIVNSKNVSITNCIVDASDDAICLKSEGQELDSCVNIYVANCTLRSSASAFKLGTGSRGGFRNVVVRNLIVSDTYRSAIALEAVDGGFLENIDIQQVRCTNTGNAIFIRLGHRNKDNQYSTVKNIRIAHMYAEIPAGKPDKGLAMEGPDLRYPPGIVPAKEGGFEAIAPWNRNAGDSTQIPYLHNVFPASITGLPGHPVQNITLENIELVYAGGALRSTACFPADSLHRVPESVSDYPEFSMFGELPCWGMFVRHADGVTFNNVTFRTKQDDFRVAMIVDDVKGLQLRRLNIPSNTSLPVLLLNNTPSPQMQQLNLPADASSAIKIQQLP